MNYFRQLSFISTLSFVMINLQSQVVADTERPNYNSTTQTLSMPAVSVDKDAWFGDVRLKLNFATGKFELLEALPIFPPVDIVAPFIPTGDFTRNIIDEQEANSSFGTAQKLEKIGAKNPISAQIGQAKDVDYYSFDVVAGRTYIIELFDVANNLTLKGSQHQCKDYKTFYGLFPIVYDSAENEVARQCEPNGSANVHSTLSFSAGVTGTYTIAIFPHSDSVIGTYRLQVLPKYNESDSAWDLQNFEPNNLINIAYPIKIGAENSLSSEIEQRNSQFATNSGDRDSYHFQASAGETYTIELFDVSNNLVLKGDQHQCKSYKTYQGLFPIVYDPATNEVVRQCEPNGSGEIHSAINFTAGIDGTYTIKVVPHSNLVSGTYNIRVLKE